MPLGGSGPRPSHDHPLAVNSRAPHRSTCRKASQTATHSSARQTFIFRLAGPKPEPRAGGQRSRRIGTIARSGRTDDDHQRASTRGRNEFVPRRRAVNESRVSVERGELHLRARPRSTRSATSPGMRARRTRTGTGARGALRRQPRLTLPRRPKPVTGSRPTDDAARRVSTRSTERAGPKPFDITQFRDSSPDLGTPSVRGATVPWMRPS